MVAAITSLSHRYYFSTSAHVYSTFKDTNTDTKVQKSIIRDGRSTPRYKLVTFFVQFLLFKELYTT